MLFLKKIFISLLGKPPISSLFHFIFKKKPLVVLYHGVTNKKTTSGIENYRGKHVHISLFRQQLIYLSRYFTIVTLAEIENLVKKNEKPKKPLCAITFDDGYKNNYTNAYPILKELNLPATVFVTTNFLDSDKPLWTDRLEYILGNTNHKTITANFPQKKQIYDISTKKLRMISDNDIRQKLKSLTTEERTKIIDKLAEDSKCDLKKTTDGPHDYAALSWEEALTMSQNNISIGAHTLTHPTLATLSPEEQLKEITLSTERVRSKIGNCEHFAYPNGQQGDWNSETKIALIKSGFKVAWTTLPGRINTTTIKDPFTLSRITLDESGLSHRFEALSSNSLPFIKFFLR